MADSVKVYTPIKRVPTMIGKTTNGKKLPFGPYTIPQIGALTAGMAISGTFAMSLPVNPALTFAIGMAISVVVAMTLRLVPYTGVRLTSRFLWMARLFLFRKPVVASSLPVTDDSKPVSLFVEESVVLMIPTVQDAP